MQVYSQQNESNSDTITGYIYYENPKKPKYWYSYIIRKKQDPRLRTPLSGI